MKTPKRSNEDWRVKVRDWWYRVQDDCVGMMHTLPESRRVEIETIIKQVLTEKDAEVEKDRTTLYTSLVAAVEGKKKNSKYNYTDDEDNKASYAGDWHYNQALDDTLTIINSIFKE